MRSAPTLSGSSTSRRTGRSERESMATAGAAGGSGHALHHALGHRRRHRREAHRADLVGRMSGLEDERAERAAPLVRRAIRIGGQPPVRLQRVGLEQPGGDLGVADVEGEQHGSKLRRVRGLGQLDRARADRHDAFRHPGARGARRPPRCRPPIPRPAAHTRRPRSQSRAASSDALALGELGDCGVERSSRGSRASRTASGVMSGRTSARATAARCKRLRESGCAR